jgi:hypothetical protein
VGEESVVSYRHLAGVFRWLQDSVRWARELESESFGVEAEYFSEYDRRQKDDR